MSKREIANIDRGLWFLIGIIVVLFGGYVVFALKRGAS